MLFLPQVQNRSGSIWTSDGPKRSHGGEDGRLHTIAGAKRGLSRDLGVAPSPPTCVRGESAAAGFSSGLTCSLARGGQSVQRYITVALKETSACCPVTWDPWSLGGKLGGRGAATLLLLSRKNQDITQGNSIIIFLREIQQALHWLALAPFSKVTWVCEGATISGFCILFHWFMKGEFFET